MMRWLWLFMTLLCAPLLCISQAAYAQNTNPVSINGTSWTSLGTGPLSVAAPGPEWPNVALIQSAAQPANSIAASFGEPLRDKRFFGQPMTVWAKSAAASASVIVTAPDAGSVTQKDQQLVPAGNFQVSVTATAQNLAALIAAAVPANARLVYIEPESGDIRFRDDGTAPAASTGMRIYSGVAWPYSGNLSAIQLIGVAGTVTVNLAFYQ